MHNEFREELRFVRHKFLAHSEYTQDELKKINLSEYDSLIAEDELISNLIINCNEGIVTMLNFKWS